MNTNFRFYLPYNGWHTDTPIETIKRGANWFTAIHKPYLHFDQPIQCDFKTVFITRVIVLRPYGECIVYLSDNISLTEPILIPKVDGASSSIAGVISYLFTGELNHRFNHDDYLQASSSLNNISHRIVGENKIKLVEYDNPSIDVYVYVYGQRFYYVVGKPYSLKKERGIRKLNTNRGIFYYHNDFLIPQFPSEYFSQSQNQDANGTILSIDILNYDEFRNDSDIPGVDLDDYTRTYDVIEVANTFESFQPDIENFGVVTGKTYLYDSLVGDITIKTDEMTTITDENGEYTLLSKKNRIDIWAYAPKDSNLRHLHNIGTPKFPENIKEYSKLDTQADSTNKNKIVELYNRTTNDTLTQFSSIDQNRFNCWAFVIDVSKVDVNAPDIPTNVDDAYMQINGNVVCKLALKAGQNFIGVHNLSSYYDITIMQDVFPVDDQNQTVYYNFDITSFEFKSNESLYKVVVSRIIASNQYEYDNWGGYNAKKIEMLDFEADTNKLVFDSSFGYQ